MHPSLKIILCLPALLLFFICAPAHTYKVPLLVDTDMSLDDVRALILLLNSDVATIHLMTTSDGGVLPRTGAENLARLAHCFHRTDITIAAGRELGKPPPPWRRFSENLLPDVTRKKGTKILLDKPAATAIVDSLNSQESPAVYLCIGPLTNLADAMKTDAGIADNISRVIYFGNAPSTPRAGWNTLRDPESAEFIFRSALRIYALDGTGADTIAFNRKLYSKIKKLDTPASRLLVRIHDRPSIPKTHFNGHFRVWDETTVIYLNQPGLFAFSRVNRHVHTLQNYNPTAVTNAYLKLMGHPGDSHLKEREVVVFNYFPTHESLFKDDVRPFIRKILDTYGLEEWKACVLTNELHRHLGIYSIAGAKMGIWAREILTAPLDGVVVVSWAGNKPPLSCMNDGLQAATGASLGRGTITVRSDSPRPAATFSYNGKSVTLEIKPKWINKIKEDIRTALQNHGSLTPEYFAHIRILSLRYWLEMDRAEMFRENPE